MTTIHYKIKSLRHKHGLTQLQVAEKLICSVPAYSKIETGATDITDTRLRKLAALYEMRISQIYEYGEPNENEQQHIIDELREENTKYVRLISDLQKKVIQLYEERNKRPGLTG